MSTNFPLFPQQASVQAGQVDAIYFFMVAVTAFFSLLIAGLIIFFAVKYRRRTDDEVGAPIYGSLALELLWTIIPFIISMGMFAWGAKVFFDLYRVPAGAMEIFVVGKQWMWKVQHPTGVREINEMHVPIDRNIRLTMGSEDVVHDYSIPAFRVKMDVVPGKLTTMWFKATVPGTYHLFCAEYCGTMHSGMIGRVIAMTPPDYLAWLSRGTSATNVSPAELGQKLFAGNAVCFSCHLEDGKGHGPALGGVYGSTVMLADGRKVVADDNYLRESIVNPSAKIVRGFPSPSIMPPLQGMLSEEQLMQLIAYIKTLKPTAQGY
jgi:cytochrome c oxidase subunit II